MTDKEVAVLRFLQRKSFATPGEVAERFAIQPGTARLYLRRLMDRGLLEMRELGRIRGYRAR